MVTQLCSLAPPPQVAAIRYTRGPHSVVLPVLCVLAAAQPRPSLMMDSLISIDRETLVLVLQKVDLQLAGHRQRQELPQRLKLHPWVRLHMLRHGVVPASSPRPVGQGTVVAWPPPEHMRCQRGCVCVARTIPSAHSSLAPTPHRACQPWREFASVSQLSQMPPLPFFWPTCPVPAWSELRGRSLGSQFQHVLGKRRRTAHMSFPGCSQ